jgi:hypothetical protein
VQQVGARIAAFAAIDLAAFAAIVLAATPLALAAASRATAT